MRTTAVTSDEERSPASPSDIAPVRRLWTLEEYEQLLEIGLLQNNRPMLINGEIWLQMGQKPMHSLGIGLMASCLRTLFPEEMYWVRQQMPLYVGTATDAEPDIAVVRGSMRDLGQNHPTSALLVVEISDTTLAFDRADKAGIYAAAGVADYWIANLASRRIEVMRQPIPDSAHAFGHHYGQMQTFLPGDALSSLAAPEQTLRVDDLLPWGDA